MKPLSFLWALVMLLAMSPGAYAAQGAQAPQQRTYIGQETCVGCHDTEGTNIHQTAHGKKQIPGSPEAEKGCESCHGPGSAHLDDPSVPGSINRFTQMKPRDVSATCLTCHTRGNHTHCPWHELRGPRAFHAMLCHIIHVAMKTRAQPLCHARLRGAQIDVCDTGLLKSQLGAPLTNERGELHRRWHLSCHDSAYQ